MREKKIPRIVRKATNDLSIYADGKKEEIVSGWRNAMIATAGKNADSIRAQAKTDGMNEDAGWIALISLVVGMGIMVLILKATSLAAKEKQLSRLVDLNLELKRVQAELASAKERL